MCDSNIPLPDFDFDDFDISSFEVPFKGSPQCRFTLDVSEIVGNFGFRLLSETPIKATSNSSVYLAKSLVTDENYALKISMNKSRIYKEYENWQCLPPCDFTVESYDVYEYENMIILQMEFCDGSDIYGVLLEENIIWKLIHNISNALASIHSEGYIHLDISPSNILVKGDGDFKLADFGTIIENGTFQPGDEGAGPYASPEVLNYPGGPDRGYFAVTPAADIFSFGVVLLEVSSGFFAPRGGSAKYEELRRGKVKLGEGIYQCSCSNKLVDLINLMLNPDPMMRPTAAQLTNLFSV